jgi:Rrf2 family protein
MPHLSQAARYAVAAIVQLDTAGPPIPCSTLAKKGDMPERFLLQVLRTLVNNQILISSRGVIGGYKLARPLEEISLADVCAAIDGPITAPDKEAFPEFGAKARVLAAAFKAAAASTYRALDGVTLAQLTS